MNQYKKTRYLNIICQIIRKVLLKNSETNTPEKEIVTKDIQIFSNGIEDNAVKDLLNSIENIDKDYSLKNFEIEEAKSVNSNNEYQRFHKNVDIDEFKDSHIET